MKRKIWIYMFLVLMIAGQLWAAQAKPMAKNAGRIVSLTPVFHITGETEDGGFFLKTPINLKIAPDESFFVLDEEQFLRFDKNGKFLGNQQKNGLGPGEYLWLSNYFFSKKSVFLYSVHPMKTMETDLNGKLIKEYRNTLTRRMREFVLGFAGNTFWSVVNPLDLVKEKAGNMDINLELAQQTMDGKVQKTGLVFPEKVFIFKQTEGKMMQVFWDVVIPVLNVCDGQNTLYISNSQQYAIKKVDLTTKKITATFSRNYVSVPYQKEEKEQPFRDMNPEKPKFFNDVQALYLNNDTVWVLTSTVTKGKGVLVDVFSKDGTYLDNFYLPLPGITAISQLNSLQLAVNKDYLLVVELDDEENPQIVKYRFRL